MPSGYNIITKKLQKCQKLTKVVLEKTFDTDHGFKKSFIQENYILFIYCSSLMKLQDKMDYKDYELF